MWYHVMRDGLPALLCEPFNLRWVGTVEQLQNLQVA